VRDLIFNKYFLKTEKAVNCQLTAFCYLLSMVFTHSFLMNNAHPCSVSVKCSSLSLILFKKGEFKASFKEWSTRFVSENGAKGHGSKLPSALI